ncbi:hypothetical protein [Veronia pacifica]|uniref:Uncharacterized protein n=1 Tax=Veronia pacifica TaxID=1080227 RepID=A0A1C3EAN6_9GAMM|nr:hypothetical protein [Veronia pacifica]ODA30302.1 hypothetical protein A8L45_20445 [Veronia pacifica]
MTTHLSVGQQSAAIFHRFSGIVTQKQGYTLIETPSNPTFFWGHYLILDCPPKAEQFAEWEETFRRELPDSEHLLLSWQCHEDESDIDVSYFSDKGYDISNSVFLTANQFIKPKQINESLTIRKITSDSDWSKVLELQLLTNTDYEPEKFREFSTQYFLNYRNMAEEGLGDWYGAFLGDTLVAVSASTRTDRLVAFKKWLPIRIFANRVSAKRWFTSSLLKSCNHTL